jgi:hypothetical protein
MDALVRHPYVGNGASNHRRPSRPERPLHDPRKNHSLDILGPLWFKQNQSYLRVKEGIGINIQCYHEVHEHEPERRTKVKWVSSKLFTKRSRDEGNDTETQRKPAQTNSRLKFRAIQVSSH